MDNLDLHSCSYCREIVIEDTGRQTGGEYPHYFWEMRYTFDCVAVYAKNCAFFRWVLDIATKDNVTSESDAELSLYVVGPAEDPLHLSATWQDTLGGKLCNNSLHIFAREGKSPSATLSPD
jgi:hypothetical protein